jgi:hypothetical protein
LPSVPKIARGLLYIIQVKKKNIASSMIIIATMALAMTASVVWWLACWHLVPEFAGSIPTEAVGFFPM